MINELNEKDKKAYALIRNKLIHTGKRPTLKEINEVTGGKSPRSAVIIIDRLVKIGLLKRLGDSLRLTEDIAVSTASIVTTQVPLVGVVSCGHPLLAEDNVQAYIPVSTSLAKPGSKYFLLRATGDSMNEAGINGGDILLIRQQNTAEDGKRVVALIDDEATVKIFERTSEAVILRPKSSNKKHKPIIVTENCQIQGEVIAVLPPDIN
jgi:repressor LexA